MHGGRRDHRANPRGARDAEEPLSASQIQHRLASRSRDVTTGVIRDICKDLVEEGEAEAIDDLPTEYRLVDE